MKGVSRRDFLRYSGAVGGGLLFNMDREIAWANTGSTCGDGEDRGSKARSKGVALCPWDKSREGKRRVDQTEFQYSGPHARIHAQRHAYSLGRSPLGNGCEVYSVWANGACAPTEKSWSKKASSPSWKN